MTDEDFEKLKARHDAGAVTPAQYFAAICSLRHEVVRLVKLHKEILAWEQLCSGGSVSGDVARDALKGYLKDD